MKGSSTRTSCRSSISWIRAMSMPSYCTAARRTMALTWLVLRAPMSNGRPNNRPALTRGILPSTGKPSKRPAQKATEVSAGRPPSTTARMRSSRSSSRPQTVRTAPVVPCVRARLGPRVGPSPCAPPLHHQALQRARERAKTEDFKVLYARRAGVEGTISQGVRVMGLRRSRYIGQEKTHLQHVATAAAMNIVRLIRWLDGEPHARTRRSPLVQLLRPAA